MLPNNVSQALQKGEHDLALTELRQFIKDNYDDLTAETFHQASVIEEQYGDWQRAGAAHKACLKLAPNNPIALLYSGYWLNESGFKEGSAALFSLCQDLKPEFVGLNKNSCLLYTSPSPRDS